MSVKVKKKHFKQQTQKQKNAWHHNALLGRTAMSISAMNSVINSKTTTIRQKETALVSLHELEKLYVLLKEKRVD